MVRTVWIVVTLALSGCGAPGGPVSATPGSTCYAGAYVCPMPTPGRVGAECSCPGIGAPSYGVIN
jgi:hypothetical protein